MRFDKTPYALCANESLRGSASLSLPGLTVIEASTLLYITWCLYRSYLSETSLRTLASILHSMFYSLLLSLFILMFKLS